MKEAKNLIIGFGKAGKTLAGFMAGQGEKTVLVEKSPLMYGGTCINVACIPSKFLELKARESRLQGGSLSQKEERYSEAIKEKKELTAFLRQKNYEKAVAAGVEIIIGQASFLSSHVVSVKKEDGTKEEIKAERIIINTGSRPFIPPIKGLQLGGNIYTSETLMEQPFLPNDLLILGGGYIGLEFASYYNNFGSKVTVIQDGEGFMPREDEEISSTAELTFIKRGISLMKSVKVLEARQEENKVVLSIEKDGIKSEIQGDGLLIATGRRPNTDGLDLTKAGIEVSPRGSILTDEHKMTSIQGVYACGDVADKLQFTYISLDDSRIVKESLFGKGSRNENNRGEIPYTVFLDPPLSSIGLTQKEAEEKGYEVSIGRLKAAGIPKARVLGQTEGLLKAIIDKKTGLILGCHLYCAESYEMINLIKLAMDNKIPYTVLKNSIYNHPTMTEAFNDLFAVLS